jgi:tripartite-type tricarboxylate transporter receptor subunit TctC
MDTRRTFFSLLAMAALSAAIGAAHAAPWPEGKPITVIVPASAGSSLDINIRRVMEDVAKTLKQTIIIDNRPGSGGAIAMPAIAQAAPDGYTLGVGNTAALVITPEINPKVRSRYSVATDFEYVARFTSQANLLVVKPSLPVKTVAELTQYVRAHPGKAFMGSQGNGSTGHLSGEAYKKAIKGDFTHVPYRSGPQAVQDMLAGNTDFMFENIATIESNVEAGKVRALAVTSPKRNPRFPKIPTMQEAGIAGYEVVSWAGIIAPAKTPKDIVARLNTALNAALSKPEIKAYVEQRGATVEGGSSAEFRAFLDAETVKWQALIKSIGGLTVE